MIAKYYLHHVYNRQIKFGYKIFISYGYVLTNKEKIWNLPTQPANKNFAT